MAVDRDKDVLGGDLPPGRRICPRQRVPGDHLDFVLVLVFPVISFVVVVVVVAIANKSAGQKDVGRRRSWRLCLKTNAFSDWIT